MKCFYLFLCIVLFGNLLSLEGSSSSNMQIAQSSAPGHESYKTDLMSALEERNLTQTKALLQKIHDLDFQNSEGITPLIFALAQDYDEGVQLLLDHGASIEAPGFENESLGADDMRRLTPLHTAVMKNSKWVRVFLQKGAKAQVYTSTGETPLHTAMRCEGLSHVDDLVGAGAEKDSRDSNGNTPLLTAAAKGYTDAVSHLLTLDVNKHAKNKDNENALLIAAFHGHDTTLGVLLDAGLDKELKATQYRLKGNTALHVSATKSDACVKILLEKGANPSPRNRERDTPLHLASGKDSSSLKAIELLINAHADLNAQNDKGSTPLHRAVDSGNTQAIKALLASGASALIKDHSGHTPVWLACKYTFNDCFKLFRDANIPLPRIPRVLTSFPLDDCSNLSVAASCGELEEVQKYIARNIHLQAHDYPEGITPLHTAVINHQHSVVQALVDAGVYLETQDDDGETALHAAAYVSCNECLDLLLKAGAQRNALTHRGNTPLHCALIQNPSAKHYWLQIREVQIKDSDNEEREKRREQYVKTLLETSVNIEVQNCDGNAPLHLAAQCENPLLTILLLSKKANVKVINILGNTPLHEAATFQNGDSLKALIEADAELNARNENQATPLHCATEKSKKSDKCIEMLLKLGADRDAQDSMGDTPLHYAAQHDRELAIACLLLAKALVTIANNEGNTALHFAVGTKNEKCIVPLLEAGAAVEAKNIWGNTPLHIAAEDSSTLSPEISIELLLKYNAQVNVTNNEGATPLHLATPDNKRNIKALLAAGANRHQKDLFGNLPDLSAYKESNEDT